MKQQQELIALLCEIFLVVHHLLEQVHAAFIYSCQANNNMKQEQEQEKEQGKWFIKTSLVCIIF
jgi:hypothetical protein